MQWAGPGQHWPSLKVGKCIGTSNDAALDFKACGGLQFFFFSPILGAEYLLLVELFE
jgi:hypothetical protein